MGITGHIPDFLSLGDLTCPRRSRASRTTKPGSWADRPVVAMRIRHLCRHMPTGNTRSYAARSQCGTTTATQTDLRRRTVIPSRQRLDTWKPRRHPPLESRKLRGAAGPYAVRPVPWSRAGGKSNHSLTTSRSSREVKRLNQCSLGSVVTRRKVLR